MPARSWFWRFLNEKDDDVLEDAVALVDASTVYGAGRWLFGDHQRSDWKYARQFKADEDRILFVEFLTNLILYDHVLMDNSSVIELGQEVKRVLEAVKFGAGDDILCAARVCHVEGLRPVIEVVCKLVAEASVDRESRDILLSIDIPWYYKTHLHIDGEIVARAAIKWGLDSSLWPVTLFVFRGLCYADYANNLSQSHQSPCSISGGAWAIGGFKTHYIQRRCADAKISKGILWRSGTPSEFTLLRL